jgi:hypothetical protein
MRLNAKFGLVRLLFTHYLVVSPYRMSFASAEPGGHLEQDCGALYKFPPWDHSSNQAGLIASVKPKFELLGPL